MLAELNKKKVGEQSPTTNSFPTTTTNPVFEEKLNSFKIEIEKTLADFEKKFQQESINHVSKQIDDLIAYAANNEQSIKNHITKAVQEQIAKNIDGFKKEIVINNFKIDLNGKHPSFEEVFVMLKLFKKAYLWGPTGAGKTFMCSQIAKEMNIPYGEISGNVEMSKFELIGYKNKDGENETPSFLQMYKNGGLFVFDEIDSVPSEVSVFINAVADARNSIYISHLGEVPKHPDFYLILCANTRGTGSFEYAGRQQMDKALLDRFRIQTIFVDYDASVELAICEGNSTIYNFYKKLRKDLEDKGSYLSTRNISELRKIELSLGKDAVLKRFAP